MSTIKASSQNRVASDPSLTDVLDLHKKDIMLAFNCHAIGTIQSFDSTTQTASVSINYKKTYLQADPVTGIYKPQLSDYPLIVDCPVFVNQGGLAALTMPIVKGDTCIILFNDRDIDNWYQTGQVGPLATQRLHSFSDGMILVGVSSELDPVIPYNGSNAVLQNGPNTKVSVGLVSAQMTNSVANIQAGPINALMGSGASSVTVAPTTVTIIGGTASIVVGPALVTFSNGSTTLNPVLQGLISAIQSLTNAVSVLTVTCNTPGSPSSAPLNGASFTAVTTALSSVSTQLATLLG